MIPNFSDKKTILGRKAKFPLGYWMNLGTGLRLAEFMYRSINR